MTDRGAETGAVVVEALVAVLIIAAMAGLWFDTIVQGARQQHGLADRRLAMLVVESQAATVGIIGATGERRGSDAGMDWQIDVEPFAQAGAGIEKLRVSAGRPGGPPLASVESLRFGGSDAR